MSIGVIIPAGGSGVRMGLSKAKQYHKIKGVPVIDRTLLIFQKHPEISEIVLVLPVNDAAALGKQYRKRYSKISAVVAGGKERTHSVRNGLHAFTQKHRTVLVHDGVRPFVRPADISNLIREIKKCDAATLAVPVKDTIKIVNRTRILGTPNRKTLWHTLTPQIFRAETLERLFAYAQKHRLVGTDECMLAEKMGRDVRVVEGSYYNIKITTPEDLILAEAIAGLKKRAD